MWQKLKKNVLNDLPPKTELRTGRAKEGGERKGREIIFAQCDFSGTVLVFSQESDNAAKIAKNVLNDLPKNKQT